MLADGLITAADVMSHRRHADMLVLSGCETGVADVQGGDELAGLAQAFLQAGARALVVSLWAVDDAATASLMAAFYQASRRMRADGANALREAMNQVRTADNWNHPYFWGGFIFIGAW